MICFYQFQYPARDSEIVLEIQDYWFVYSRQTCHILITKTDQLAKWMIKQYQIIVLKQYQLNKRVGRNKVPVHSRLK